MPRSGGFAEVPDRHARGFDRRQAPGAGDVEADEIRVHLGDVLRQRQQGAGVVAPQDAGGWVDAEQAQGVPAEVGRLKAPLLDPGGTARVRLVPIDTSEPRAGGLGRGEGREAPRPGENRLKGKRS